MELCIWWRRSLLCRKERDRDREIVYGKIFNLRTCLVLTLEEEKEGSSFKLNFTSILCKTWVMIFLESKTTVMKKIRRQQKEAWKERYRKREESLVFFLWSLLLSFYLFWCLPSFSSRQSSISYIFFAGILSKLKRSPGISVLKTGFISISYLFSVEKEVGSCALCVIVSMKKWVQRITHSVKLFPSSSPFSPSPLSSSSCNILLIFDETENCMSALLEFLFLSSLKRDSQ